MTRSILRRPLAVAIAALVALVLTACAGLPLSGPVQSGPPVSSDVGAPDTTFRPNAPQPGATPQQIVEGFITAASGPQNDWQVAREYLAPETTWNPRAGVIVDVLADRSYTSTSADAITLQVTPSATVNATGSYTPDDGGSSTLPFTLERQPQGEWRISKAPDGIVLDVDMFRNVYHSYSVMYFDATWQYLVPDVRWFPIANAASYISDALVNGAPSPWLARSVQTAFPGNVTLRPSVPVSGGVAQAELSEQALTLDKTTLNRMQTQLAASLATAQVAQVDMLVDGSRLDAQRVATRNTTVDARALASTDAGFGFLVSGTLSPIPGLSDEVQSVAPTAIEVSADGTTAAVRLPDGRSARVTSDGQTAIVDDRPGLLAPTMDPFAVIWTLPAASPSGLRAITPTGERIDIAGAAWGGATRIEAMRVSRDGSRLAVIATVGMLSVVMVAGVVRDPDGTPTALGDQIALGTLSAPGTDLGWLDSTTTAALAGTGSSTSFVTQPVGGAPTVVDAPDGAVSLAGGNSTSGARVRTADGVVFVQRSSTWVQTATGVKVLAVQQGAPQ